MRNEVRSDKNLASAGQADRQGSPPAYVTSATHASACQGSFPPQLLGDPLSPFCWSQNNPKTDRGAILSRDPPNEPRAAMIGNNLRLVNYSPVQDCDTIN